MSNVGAFPGWKELNRRTVRAPVNPLDKATVFSIFPLEVVEKKHTLQPGEFKIEAGSYEKPSRLVVGPSSWWREIDPEQPLLEIPVASVLIADSVVRDYCVGLLACNMGNLMPGLFYVPGEMTATELKIKYPAILDDANTKQRAWYTELIKIADIAWSRTNGNPLAVNELMKFAAKELGIENRDWLKTYQAVSMTRCPACGSLKNPTYPICPTCRALDPAYKGPEIKFAER